MLDIMRAARWRKPNSLPATEPRGARLCSAPDNNTFLPAGIRRNFTGAGGHVPHPGRPSGSTTPQPVPVPPVPDGGPAPRRVVSPAEFLLSLDNEIRNQVLFSGYSGIQFLELDMESLGFDRNATSLFKDCPDELYYRFFPPFSPRHPFPYSDLPPSDLTSISSCLTRVDIGLFALENLIEGENSVRAGFSICTSWQPAREEIRKIKYNIPQLVDPNPFSNIEYQPLPLDAGSLQNEITLCRSMGYFTSYGPPLIFSTTRTREEKSLGTADFDRVQAHRLEDGHVQLSATTDVSASLLTEGNFQRFPFDTRVATFHVTSGSPLREMKFAPLEEMNIRDKAQELSQANDWIVQPEDVKVMLMYRDVHSRDWNIGNSMGSSINLHREGLTSRRAEMRDRCKILVEITFRRNWHHWFWKIMFPLDVITTVGFAMFLLMPQVPVQGPTADQRIAMATYLVTVLLAQAAFIISARPLLPKVSHMTILDIHNNLCFLFTAVQALLFALIPGHSWASFGSARNRYPTFIAVLALLVLEHIFIFSFSPWSFKKPKQPMQSQPSGTSFNTDRVLHSIRMALNSIRVALNSVHVALMGKEQNDEGPAVPRKSWLTPV